MGDQLKENIIQEIKKTNVYGLLTDEVTDLSNTLQLVTFIKYYDQNLGDARTRFVNVNDVLEGSVDTTATAETIHDCLINLLNSLDLKIQNAKALHLMERQLWQDIKVVLARDYQNMKIAKQC